MQNSIPKYYQGEVNKALYLYLKSHTFTIEDNADNYGGNNEYFKKDQAEFHKNKLAAISLLKNVKDITRVEMIEATSRAFSGRLNFNPTQLHFHYIAGQYYDLEVPQAVRVVLEYIKDHR